MGLSHWVAVIRSMKSIRVVYSWLAAGYGFTDRKNLSRISLAIMEGRWPHEAAWRGLKEAEGITDDDTENWRRIWECSHPSKLLSVGVSTWVMVMVKVRSRILSASWVTKHTLSTHALTNWKQTRNVILGRRKRS